MHHLSANGFYHTQLLKFPFKKKYHTGEKIEEFQREAPEVMLIKNLILLSSIIEY